jgi:hypothetical protein
MEGMSGERLAHPRRRRTHETTRNAHAVGWRGLLAFLSPKHPMTMEKAKDRKLRIEPIMKDGLPICHDACESRCLKGENQIGPSGCYAWDKRMMGTCPENPTVCHPWQIQNMHNYFG